MNAYKVRRAVICAAFGALLAGCQVGGSTVSDREGYFTWVDEQGRVRYSPKGEPERSPDSTEFTSANYPDAEELRRKGYVREEDGQPYFTWRDSEGNVRTTYYRPETPKDDKQEGDETPAGNTPATVYRAGDMHLAIETVDGRDPDAFAILGIEESSKGYLEHFSDTCCQAMDAQDHESWQEGREFGIRLTDDSPVHQFLTGASPYQLIALPRGDKFKARILRLRSYASKGVFVPSVVFLDSELNPVRLVTDLVSDFEPENWHRLGYLEARIPVLVSKEERWMVLFTRRQDLEGQTVIETRHGPRKIPHINTGEFGLIMVETE
ncbi:MalM family protein [Marinobacter sp. 1_MG-2023]|uniref:MalM family protein n=1 Tax=Marinobacter sp. 1_MG-2023 TaxID=3062627 RepID=UPI0026E19B97|nr:MalM family protein [Marinobacter sp. 1_MG-2023]MDO6823438.1 MalM family protein [Marinobacter sp. 1_MG-2023]